MPGGSPYFETVDQIEKMYKDVESFFYYVSTLEYKGATLLEYSQNK